MSDNITINENVPINIWNYMSAYAIAVKHGFVGTVEEWLESLEGKSAYDLAVEAGYEGTEEEWIAACEENRLDSEAYAAGTRNGEDVDSDDPSYHNNAKYYSEYAHTEAEYAETCMGYANTYANNALSSANNAAKWATGSTTGTPGATNNASYYASQASGAAASAAESAADALSYANTIYGSVNAAQASAEEASGFAQDARDEAVAAFGYKETAASSAETAVSAKETAVSAKEDAEDARDEAETARGEAVAAADDAANLVGAVYPAYATESDSGAVAYTTLGADGVPVKAVSVSGLGDYAAAPDVYIQVAEPHNAAWQNTNQASPRCIIFPCVGLTPYTVTVAVSATLRIASFSDYPAAGSTPSNYASASGTTISITPLAGDKWILAQLLADSDGKTFADVTGAGFGISPAPVWITDVIRRSGKNLAPAATLSSLWTSTGSLSSGGTHTPCIPVVAGEKYAWRVTTANASHTYLVWYDASFSQISVAATERRLVANTTSVVLTAPTGAAWASLSFRAAQGALQFERASAASAIEAHSEAASELTISDGTLTPALTTVRGINTVWADSGSVAVEFRCDPALYLDARLAALRPMLAYVESGMKATRNYTAGEYVCVGDSYYKITANVASGGDLTVGTNVTATTVGAELTALQ